MRKIRKPGPKGAPPKLKFNCPWVGHAFDPNFELRNSSAPHIVGKRCAKCGCLVYLHVKQSVIVGPGGVPLTRAGA